MMTQTLREMKTSIMKQGLFNIRIPKETLHLLDQTLDLSHIRLSFAIYWNSQMY